MKSFLLIVMIVFIGSSCGFHSATNHKNKVAFRKATQRDSIYTAFDFFQNQGVSLKNYYNSQKLFFVSSENQMGELLVRYGNKFILFDKQLNKDLGLCYVTKTESLPESEGTWSFDTISINPKNSAELQISKKVKRSRIFYSIIKDEINSKLIIREYCLLSKQVNEDFGGNVSLREWLKLDEKNKQQYLLYECSIVTKNDIIVSFGEVIFTGDCVCEMFSHFGEVNRLQFYNKHLSFVVLKIIANFW